MCLYRELLMVSQTTPRSTKPTRWARPCGDVLPSANPGATGTEDEDDPRARGLSGPVDGVFYPRTEKSPFVLNAAALTEKATTYSSARAAVEAEAEADSAAHAAETLR